MHKVDLTGVILKPNMILAGAESKNQISNEETAKLTIKCLKESVPNEVPGIAFLSGGQTEIQATENLNLINKFNDIGDYHFYLVCGKNEEEGAIKIIDQIKKGNCDSLSSKDISEIIYYIYLSDIFIGNDSFGHHVACQMNKPSFIILIDSPKAYSDYSKNQFRIIPPDTDINKITHRSSLDPNSITVEMVMDEIRNFI